MSVSVCILYHYTCAHLINRNYACIHVLTEITELPSHVPMYMHTYVDIYVWPIIAVYSNVDIFMRKDTLWLGI